MFRSVSEILGAAGGRVHRRRMPDLGQTSHFRKTCRRPLWSESDQTGQVAEIPLLAEAVEELLGSHGPSRLVEVGSSERLSAECIFHLLRFRKCHSTPSPKIPSLRSSSTASATSGPTCSIPAYPLRPVSRYSRYGFRWRLRLRCRAQFGAGGGSAALGFFAKPNLENLLIRCRKIVK